MLILIWPRAFQWDLYQLYAKGLSTCTVEAELHFSVKNCARTSKVCYIISIWVNTFTVAFWSQHLTLVWGKKFSRVVDPFENYRQFSICPIHWRLATFPKRQSCRNKKKNAKRLCIKIETWTAASTVLMLLSRKFKIITDWHFSHTFCFQQHAQVASAAHLCEALLRWSGFLHYCGGFPFKR